MESVPSSSLAPAEPKRGLPTLVVVAITSSVFLSLFCFCSSIPIFLGVVSPYIRIQGETTYLTGPAGLCCVGAGFIPWIITAIIWLVSRQKGENKPITG